MFFWHFFEDLLKILAMSISSNYNHYAARALLFRYCEANPSDAKVYACASKMKFENDYQAICPSSDQSKTLRCNISQVKQLRALLALSVSLFVHACRFNEQDALDVQAFLRAKLLKASGAATIGEFLKKESLALHGARYFRLLDKIIEGRFVSNHQVACARKKYLEQKAAGGIRPFLVSTFFGPYSKEMFEEIVINGVPHAIFCNKIVAESCNFDLREHNVIVLETISADDSITIRGKSVLILSQLFSRSGTCSVEAEKYAITMGSKDKKSYRIKALAKHNFFTKYATRCAAQIRQNLVRSLEKMHPLDICTYIFEIPYYALELAPDLARHLVEGEYRGLEIRQMIREFPLLVLNFLGIPTDPFIGKPPIPEDPPLEEPPSHEVFVPIRSIRRTPPVSKRNPCAQVVLAPEFAQMKRELERAVRKAVREDRISQLLDGKI